MTRRTFCQQALSLGLTALAAPVRAADALAPTPRRRFHLSLSPGSIGAKASQREAIELARRHGFEAVEPFWSELAALPDAALDDLTSRLREERLVWGVAGLPLDFRGDEERVSAGLKAISAQAKALQRAGVTRIGTWLSPCHRSLTYLQNFRQHQRRLRAVAEILRDHELRLGLEYVGTHTSLISAKYPFVHTLAEARDLIGEIGTGNVGLVLDSWHWWQAGDTEADLTSLRNEDIVAVDLNDAPAGREKLAQKDGERELPAATGLIPTGLFLGALIQIGYDGPVRAEPFNRALNELDNEAACAATIAALRTAVDG